MDTSTIVADAKALGAAALADAKTAGIALLTSLEGEADTSIPKLSGDAAALLNEFVPASFAPYVDPILTTAEGVPLATLDADAIAGIKTGVGIAIARIEAI